MALGDIKDKLYKKEPEKDLSKHAESEFDARAAFAAPKADELNKQDAWEKEKPGVKDYQRKAIKIGSLVFGAIVIVLLAILGFYKYKQASFSEDRVKIAVVGATEADSGRLLNYEIQIQNNNKASLQSAVLRLNYSESFMPEENPVFKREGQTSGTIDVGELKSGEPRKIAFSGKAYSPKGSIIYIEASLKYKPSSLSVQYVSANKLAVNVKSSPLKLEIIGPQNISDGNAIQYVLSFKNTGQEDYENIKLKADYPEGFTFSESNPRSSEGNNIWYVGHLSAGQEGKITVNGKLEGSRDVIRPIKAYIGESNQGQFVVHDQESLETKIVSSPLEIHQLVNGLSNLNVNAGDVLYFQISFRNGGNIGLRDVIVTEELGSPVLDYTQLKLEKGYFDQSRKIAYWKASDHPVLKFLEPGQGGVINFSAKVKGVLPVQSANDKNFVISSVAKIDSPDVPTPLEMNKIIAGNKIDMKVNSRLSLNVLGFFNDTNIPNSGPIPPVANQETTYTMHWQVGNSNNDLTNAKVESVLPTGVAMTGKIYPEDAKITYNERTNSITWDIGTMSSGTGVLTAPKEASFQIKLKPSLSQVNNFVDLLGATTFSARDLFTEQDLSVPFDKKTTMLPEDKQIIGDGYRVKGE